MWKGDFFSSTFLALIIYTLLNSTSIDIEFEFELIY
jgi:hypothetical protein